MKTSACVDGNLKKPAKQDGNDTTILSHHPYILCHFSNYMPGICCVRRRVVERSGLGSAGCVVHVDVHVE